MLTQKDSTIAAITTAPGNAAISAIRLSGPDAIAIADSIFSASVFRMESHTARYGKILSKEGASLDHVLLLLMRNPKSYTGDDTVEIFCHGNAFNTKKILNRILEAGARQAGPGEFTLKAYLNGKIDLAQAEAVQSFIASENELALEAAEKHLAGSLSKEVTHFQNELTEIAAILEAWVDFPEEGLEFASISEVTTHLSSVQEKITHLLNTFHEGKILKDGISLCLIGAPNVGKSSLMNALLRKDRAIVTNIPGTTRDIIEEDLYLNKLHFRLVDTAGIRTTDEVIEKEGIKRSEEALKKADVILFVSSVVDDNIPHTHLDPEKTIFIWNKIDLQKPKTPSPFPYTVEISVKENTGIDVLKKTIDQLVLKSHHIKKGELILTEQRHFEALKKAHAFLEEVKTGLKENRSAELVSEDMKEALRALSTIIGTNVTEDILSSIFSKFCVGK